MRANLSNAAAPGQHDKGHADTLRSVPASRSTPDPALTRAQLRVLAAVTEAGEACTADQVAERLGISVSTARKHLDELVRAELVQVDSDRSGQPGRPRLRYRSDAPTASPAAYERLSQLLLEVLSSGDAPEAVGERAGAELARSYEGSGTTALVQVMAADGFAPQVAEHDDETEITFLRCPYADAAGGHPAVVCALHRGMASGVLASDGEHAVADLEVADPRVAGCRLRLTRTS